MDNNKVGLGKEMCEELGQDGTLTLRVRMVEKAYRKKDSLVDWHLQGIPV